MSNAYGLRIFQPPTPPGNPQGRLRIFLGGSIEMGAAEDWQEKLVAYLAAKPYAGILDLYNPRRDDWDPTWPNDPNHPGFNGQVTWEIERQMESDFILYYFAANTVSAITLFELALFKDKNPIVGIDPAYKRIGNLLVTNDVFAAHNRNPMDMHIGWNAFIKALDAKMDPLGYALMPQPMTAPMLEP